nr:putative integron gene cassette protein [uncultured bacterium]
MLAAAAKQTFCGNHEQQRTEDKRRPSKVRGDAREVSHCEDANPQSRLEALGDYERPDLRPGELLDALAIAFKHGLP